MSSTLGIGLAGLGQHGVRYARHLLAGDVEHARLVAVTRRDAAAGRRFAGEHGVDFCADPGALAAHPRVDVVVGVLPPSHHPALVEAAAAASKAVVVEKPLAADVAGARRAATAARRAGLFAMVAHTLRYNGVVRALRAALPRVGAIHLAAIAQRFEPTERPWLDDPTEGGLLLNTGVHGIDLLHNFTDGRVVSGRAHERCVVTRRCSDAFAATLRIEPGGVLATLDNSRATDARLGRIELVGARGQLVGDFVRGTASLLRAHESEPIETGGPVPTIRDALRDAVRALREGREAPITVEDGLAAVEGIDIVRRGLVAEDAAHED